MTPYNPGLETLKDLRRKAVARGDVEAVARLDGKIREIEDRQARHQLTVRAVRRSLAACPAFVPASGTIRSREED